jgi:orotate phosphoribosyltransferase
MEQYKQDFIEFMVESGVLKFGEFMTKSGRLSPYFINTGNYRTGAQAARLGTYYADCIVNSGILKQNDANSSKVLFGPAYKGIPLAVSAGIALYNNYKIDVPYCFNRKEEKDHGEGGSFVGAQLKDGDNAIIVEDVITAGTQIRLAIPLLTAAADVKITDCIISADRMERGFEGKTAIAEVKDEFNITVHPIVTVKEIISHLHNREINGQVILNNTMKQKMEEYLEKYCEV